MPRVKSMKAQYQLADFRKWLLGKMASEEVSQNDIAELLHIKQPTVSYKINHNSFTLEEIIKIFHLLKVETEELSKILLY